MNAKFARNGIVMVVLIVGTLALLWTWLSSTTPSNQVGYSQFLSDVAAGQVASVEQQQETLNVTKVGTGGTYTVTVPSVLTVVYPTDMQAAAKTTGFNLPADIYKAKPVPDTGWFAVLITGAPAAHRDRRLHPVHDAPGSGHQ